MNKRDLLKLKTGDLVRVRDLRGPEGAIVCMVSAVGHAPEGAIVTAAIVKEVKAYQQTDKWSTEREGQVSYYVGRQILGIWDDAAETEFLAYRRAQRESRLRAVDEEAKEKAYVEAQRDADLARIRELAGKECALPVSEADNEGIAKLRALVEKVAAHND